MRLRPLAALIVVVSLSGCELVASFDRDKIPPPSLMRPDASFIPKPVEDIDAGMPDASTVDGGDGSVPEGGLLDGAVLDGAVLDGAVLDGAVLDASTP